MAACETKWFDLMWRNPPRDTTRAQWYAVQHWLRSCRRQVEGVLKAG